MNPSELVVASPGSPSSNYMPIFDLAQAKLRRDAMLEFVRKQMAEGVDYGTVPGSTKACLYKAGAEKLCTFFGLTPVFSPEQVIEDWTGAQFGGEMFFYYRWKCQLWRGERLISEAEGSANSWESKYRWRWTQPDGVPPGIDRSTLPCRAGTTFVARFALEKAETTGQYAKPAEFWAHCQAEVDAKRAKRAKRQTRNGSEMDGWEIDITTYRIPNPDIPDVVNTVLKISQKRALIAATLIGTNASDYFTQDLEDGASDLNYGPQSNGSDAQPSSAAKPVESKTTTAKPETKSPEAPANKSGVIKQLADMTEDGRHDVMVMAKNMRPETNEARFNHWLTTQFPGHTEQEILDYTKALFDAFGQKASEREGAA